MKILNKIAEYPILTVLAVIFLLYISTLKFGFVENVDLSMIDSHLTGQSISDYGKLGFKSIIGDFILKININIFKYEAYGYHLISMIIFAIQSILAVILFKSFFNNDKLKVFLGAIFFATNPIFIQQVAWLPARIYGIHGIFVILALIYLFKYKEKLLAQNLLLFFVFIFLSALSVPNDYFIIPSITILSFFLFNNKKVFINVAIASISAFILSIVMNYMAGYSGFMSIQNVKILDIILLPFNVLFNVITMQKTSVVSKIDFYGLGTLIIIISFLLQKNEKVTNRIKLITLILLFMNAIFLISRVIFYSNIYYYASMGGLLVLTFIFFFLHDLSYAKISNKNILYILFSTLILLNTLTHFSKIKDYKDSESYFHNIVVNNMEDQSARMSLASIYLSKNNYNKALDHFNILHNQDKNNTKYLYQIARVYFAQANWKACELTLNQIKAIDNSPVVDNLIMDVYKAKGDMDKLISNILPIALKSDTLSPYNYDIVSAYIGKANYDSAKIMAKMKLKNEVDIANMVKYLETLSKDYYKKGDNVKVIRTVEVALSIDENNQSILEYLYTEYKKAGVKNKAEFYKMKLDKLKGVASK